MGTPTNLVVLTGTVTSEPTTRSLPSSSAVAQFDVSTRIDDVNVSVPVAWHDPRASALSSIRVGTEIVVIGSVRRRFFRVGGTTQSRTEVVADIALPTTHTKSVRAALGAAAGVISPTGG